MSSYNGSSKSMATCCRPMQDDGMDITKDTHDEAGQSTQSRG